MSRKTRHSVVQTTEPDLKKKIENLNRFIIDWIIKF